MVKEDFLDVSYNEKAYFLFLDIYCPFGLSINLLGVISILVRSSPEMGVYKWYLLNYQIWGTLIDAFYGVFQCEILFPLPGGRNIGNDTYLGIDEHLCTLISMSLTAGSGAAIVACFAYRYNVVLSILGKGISQRQLAGVAVVGTSVVVSAIWFLLSQAFVPYDVARRIFLEKYPHLEPIIKGKRILFYWPDENAWITVMLTFSAALMIAMATLIGISFTKTIIALRQLRGMMSEKTYKMNMKFTLILIVQTIVPYTLLRRVPQLCYWRMKNEVLYQAMRQSYTECVLTIPVFVMTILILGQINHSTGIGMTCLAIISTHASGNTVVLLLLVKNYRDFAFYVPLAAFRQCQRLENVCRARIGLTPKVLWQSTDVSPYNSSLAHP